MGHSGILTHFVSVVLSVVCLVVIPQNNGGLVDDGKAGGAEGIGKI